jgi:hypothetical protein
LIRFIGLIIAAIIAISLLRSVIGFFGQLFGNFVSGPPKTGDPLRPPSPPRADSSQPESLQKDPVCGTFVAPSTAVHKRKDGQTYYFCSTECRDKF